MGFAESVLSHDVGLRDDRVITPGGYGLGRWVASLLGGAAYLLVKAANRLLKPATRPSVLALRSWPV